jgi:hypothetical protein
MTEAEALEKSIAKWDSIEAGIGIDRGGDNCELCKKFYLVSKGSCEACPVYAKTGRNFCWGTPYEMWCAHQGFRHDRSTHPLMALCPDCRRIAKEEADFLRSLRKE